MRLNDKRFPILNDQYALRQIGDKLYYLMNSRSGDYFELDSQQMSALKLSNGTNSVKDIAARIGVPLPGLIGFLEESYADGFVSLNDVQIHVNEPHYRYSEPPHLSDSLIEITGRCNLSCSHCFNSRFNSDTALGREFTDQQIYRLISDLDDLNCRRVQLSGGEPLMRENLWDIIESIESHHIFLDVISTNAALINEQNAPRLINRFRDNGALYISMDGLSSSTYETLRGEGTFRQFRQAISLLTDGGCRVFLNTMAIRQNLHEFIDMYNWVLQEPSIQGWRIGLPKVLGRYQENHRHLEIEFTEAIGVFQQLLERWMIDRPHFRLELSDFFRTDSLETGLEDHNLDDNPCKYAMTNCSIKPDGSVVFCASLEIHKPAVLGNANEEGLKSAWYGSRHKDFRKLTLGDLPVCRDCRYRRICGGGCRSNALLSYDDFTAPDPRACVAMQMLETKLLNILPHDFQTEAKSMINMGAIFNQPVGFRKYI